MKSLFLVALLVSANASANCKYTWETTSGGGTVNRPGMMTLGECVNAAAQFQRDNSLQSITVAHDGLDNVNLSLTLTIQNASIYKNISLDFNH